MHKLSKLMPIAIVSLIIAQGSYDSSTQTVIVMKSGDYITTYAQKL